MAKVEIIKGKNSISKYEHGKSIERQRVAAYCRVSTSREEQLNSYNSQKMYYTDIIKKTKTGFLLMYTLICKTAF